MKIAIRGGRVIDQERGLDEVRDIFVADGKIIGIEPPREAVESDFLGIPAQGLIVTPGLIDIHTHLREPGFEYKETIASGTRAAAKGGFTSIACMANTDPVNDNRSVTEYILKKAKGEGAVNVYPIGAISQGLEGKDLAEFGELKEAGAVAVSDDGCPVMDAQLMRRALEYAKAFDLVVIDHCEDLNLSTGGAMNEGPVATELGLPGIPKAAEEVMVARDLILAGLTQGRLHIAHVSTAGSVRLIREAKRMGINVTCETAPHYFTLTDEAVRGYNTNGKMNPPLRRPEDVEAVKEGLRDGTIDVIASDHAPHEADAKNVEFINAANGIIGLETTLPLTLSLVHEGVLTLMEAIAKLTINPARALGLPKGALKMGADADITIIALEKEWAVDARQLHSLSKNTPFVGWKMKGMAIMTIVAGEVR